MFRRFSTVALLTLAACGQEESETSRNAIRLDWREGDTFHVAASYRMAEAMGEETPVSIESGEPVGGDPFGELWSDEVVWTYQVVEANYTPDPSDELYEYAITGTGALTTLAVVKVTADPTLNDDEALLESDPVTYLVFREDRDRLAGIISFETVAGERVERAYASRQLGRAWSVLSQSALSMVPTYLAPYSAGWNNSERRLENGSLVTSVADGPGVVDVYYDDEMDGGLVLSRYEAGEPWPTWTFAENLTARLVSPAEAEGMRADRPPLYPEPTEDFDYRAALASSVDVDAALVIDADMVSAGGFEARTPEAYTPWAGSWWALSKGELVWGYENRDTFSDRIKDTIDPIKREMDRLSSEIRGMSDGADKDAKVTEYQTKQSELVDKLVEFYGGIMTDLDGGKLRVADGKLTHDDGWSYDLDELSPMDKFALVEYLDGHTYPNPFYLPAWEILNSYNPGGESWWGHCNGWSAAAILTNEPRQSETIEAGDTDFAFTTADIKGLLTEAHYSTYSRFYGERYNGAEQDINDLTPAHFQKIISFYIKEQGVPLVFDTTAKEAVWNYPAYKIELAIQETTAAGTADLVNINTATVDELDGLPGIGEELAAAIVEYREANGPFQSKEDIKNVDGIGDGTYEDIDDLITVDTSERTFDVVAEVTLVTDGVDETWVDAQSGPEDFTETWSYTLTTDQDGTVLSGKWDREDSHPDFAWVPYSNPHSPSSGSSENPYLDYGHLLEAIGDDYERK